MKTMRMLLLAAALVLPLASCRAVHEVLANTRFDDRQAAAELGRPATETVLPFTLNSRMDYGCPIVRYRINGEPAFFLVDTGCPEIILSDSGLKKAGTDPERLRENALPLYLDYLMQNQPGLYARLKDSPGKAMRRMKKDFKRGFLFTLENVAEFKSIWYGQGFDDEYDGVLGFGFLRNYRRATFDFARNLLILDGERIEGTAVPLMVDANGEAGTPCIEFAYNGGTEVGIIDTGNYTFSPRSNFGKDEIRYTYDGSGISWDYIYARTKRRAPVVHTYDGIEICGIRIDGIRGIYSNCWFSTYSRTAQEYLTVINGIGCELFRGKVIQFDFERMEFIMGE